MTAQDRQGNEEPVLAAGCVLWRRAPGDSGSADGDGDGVEICLVHRPKYDDWSHPKGKLKSGESALDGALREVLEETGAHCAPGPELPAVRYLVEGRPKEVRYWAAEATGGSFAPNSEVDRVRWLSPAKARELLTQERDAELVTAFLDARGPAADGR
ncbi:DNA mismatch repair protein MutT [Streptomyces inusitatus]|uniref:DNA mismatch repair protein MutT n=1 Tax=Streptomyces inusitatus TaxID=68221 RepID=A0A918QLE0_9ACTN|nr:NUDIX hydrolase [Streptomyces inusitatus]GGZ58388.1 DNA mismatch repair protein MutT [Streptomyces inusitatus]